MKEVDLGAPEQFAEFPAEIVLEGMSYWLVRLKEGGYRLLQSYCPHAGGELRPYKGILLCPLHFWTFDAEEGRGLHVPHASLLRRDVVLRDDRLYAIGEDYDCDSCAG